jgi:hypothetical protein
MRFALTGSFLLLLIILFSEAGSFAQAPPVPNPVVGKTEVKIGNPQYVGNPPTSASVPITMELDSTTKGFIDITVVVTDPRPVRGGNVPVGLTLAAPPQPGKGPVTISANFPVQKGVEYRIEASIRYINAMNMTASTPEYEEDHPLTREECRAIQSGWAIRARPAPNLLRGRVCARLE